MNQPSSWGLSISVLSLREKNHSSRKPSMKPLSKHHPKPVKQVRIKPMKWRKENNENKTHDMSRFAVLRFRHILYESVWPSYLLEENGHIKTDFGRYLHRSIELWTLPDLLSAPWFCVCVGIEFLSNQQTALPAPVRATCLESLNRNSIQPALKRRWDVRVVIPLLISSNSLLMNLHSRFSGGL